MAKNELTKDERELAEAREEERKLREDTPIVRAQAKIRKLEAKGIRKEMKKIQKLLVKAGEEVGEANENHHKMVRDGKRISLEAVQYPRKELHAKAEIERTVTRQMSLQAQLRKLQSQLDQPEAVAGKDESQAVSQGNIVFPNRTVEPGKEGSGKDRGITEEKDGSIKVKFDKRVNR